MRTIATLFTLVVLLATPAIAQALDTVVYPGDRDFRTDFISGGSYDAFLLDDVYGDACSGWIAQEPDHVLTLPYDLTYLRIYAEARYGGDLTLVLHHPSTGDIFCDDDSHGRLDPEITMTYMLAGEWHVYVGSYWRDDMHDYDFVATQDAQRTSRR
jgi:hypothetical protein